MAAEPLDLDASLPDDLQTVEDPKQRAARPAPAGRPQKPFDLDASLPKDLQETARPDQSDWTSGLGNVAKKAGGAVGSIFRSDAPPEVPINAPPPTETDGDKASFGTMAMGALSRAKDVALGAARSFQNAPSEVPIEPPQPLGPSAPGGLTQQAEGAKRLDERQQRMAAKPEEIRAARVEEARGARENPLSPDEEDAAKAKAKPLAGPLPEKQEPSLLQRMLGVDATEAARMKRMREQAKAFKQQALNEGASPQDLGSTQPEYMPGFSEAGQAVTGAVGTWTGGLLPALGDAYGLSQGRGPEHGLEQVARGAGALGGFIAGAPEKIGAAAFERTVGQLLKPVATNGAGTVVAKSIANQTGRLASAFATQSAGTALSQETLADAARVEGDAMKDGAAMGLIFGGVGYVRAPAGLTAAAEAAGPRYEAALSLGEKSARWALASAANDFVSGQNPLDDRDWSQKVFDYGLNAYFMWHRAADPKGTLRELDARARAEGEGLDGKGLDHFVQATVTAKQMIGEQEYQAYVKAYMEHGGLDQFDAMAQANNAVLRLRLQGLDPDLGRRRGEGLPGRPPLSHDAMVALSDLTHAEEHEKEVQPEPVQQPELQPEAERPPVPEPRPAGADEFRGALNILRNDIGTLKFGDRAEDRPSWFREAGLGETSKTTLFRALENLQRGQSDPQIAGVEEALAKYARENWHQIHLDHGIAAPEPAAEAPKPVEPQGKGADIPADILAGIDDIFGALPPVDAENNAPNLRNEKFSIKGMRSPDGKDYRQENPGEHHFDIASRIPGEAYTNLQDLMEKGYVRWEASSEYLSVEVVADHPEAAQQAIDIVRQHGRGRAPIYLDIIEPDALEEGFRDRQRYDTFEHKPLRPYQAVEAIRLASGEDPLEVQRSMRGAATDALPNETLDRMRRLAMLATESATKGVDPQRFFDAVTARGADRGMVLRAMKDAYPEFKPGAANAPVVPTAQGEGAARPEAEVAGTPEVPPAEQPAGGERPPGAAGPEGERAGEAPQPRGEQPTDGRPEVPGEPGRPVAGPGDRPAGGPAERPAGERPGTPERGAAPGGERPAPEGGAPEGQLGGPGRGPAAGERPDVGGRGAELGGAPGGGAGRAGAISNGPGHERIGPGGRFHQVRGDYTRRLEAEPGDDVYLKGLGLNEIQQQGFLRMRASIEGPLGAHFLADGTGVGKTRQLLAIAKYLTDRGNKVVYVAPQAALKIDMKAKKITGTLGKEAALFNVPVKIHMGIDPVEPGLLHVMTIEKFGRMAPDPDLVIIADEAHFMKNVMKGTVRALHGMRMMNQAKIAIFATATPIDEPQHLPFLQRIGVYEGETERDAMRKLGMIMERAPNGKGSYWKPVNERETDRRLGLLFDRLTYNGGARNEAGGPDHTQPGSVTQRELAMEATLQGKDGKVGVNLSSIPMPDEVWGVVQKILDGYARHPGASFNEFKGMYKARVLHAVRRAMENYKIPATVTMVKKALADGRQAVIFLDRTNESEAGLTEAIRDRWGNVVDEVRHVFHRSEGTVPALIAALKAEGIDEAQIGQIHSGKTAKSQISDMQDFQSGAKKIVVATIGSGATGIDLDDQKGDRPRTMVVMTAPFSALEAIQAMGRVWRQQTQSFPETHFLHSELDIDRWNMGIIARKLNTLGAALSGPLVKTLDLDQRPTPADLSRAAQVPDDRGFQEPQVPKAEPNDLKEQPTLRAFEEPREKLLGTETDNQHELARAQETLRNLPQKALREDAKGEYVIGEMDPEFKRTLATTLYKGDVGWIAVKELLQNSVDALRPVHEGDSGKLKMSVDTQKKIIHIVDNGIGMPPEVAVKQYVNIGGSIKPGGVASGGFGVAKVAILGNSETIHMSTVAEVNGEKIRTTLQGTGDDWLDVENKGSGLRVLREAATPDTPTGTEILVHLKPTTEMGRWATASAMNSFLRNHNLPFDFDLRADGERLGQERENTEPVKKLTTIESKGALIDFYAGDKTRPTSYFSATILNNGLPQFEKNINLSRETRMPQRVLIDVRSKAGPQNNPDYPWTPSREELRGDTDAVIRNYVMQNLFSASVEKERQAYANAFSKSPLIKGSNMRLVDTSRQISADKIKAIAENPFYGTLTKAFRDVFEGMQEIFGKHSPQFGRVSMDGLGLGSDYRAVNVPDRYLRPEGGPDNGIDHVLMNPWGILDGIRREVREGEITEEQAPRAVASWMTAAIAHELVHQVAKGHDETFATQMTAALARLASTGYDNKAVRKLTDLLTGNEGHGYKQIADDLDAIRDDWVSKEDDLFGKVGEHLGPVSGLPAGEGVPEGSRVSGGGPESGVRPGGPDAEAGDAAKRAELRGADLSTRQRGLLEDVGRHVQDLHPDQAEWKRRMADELPARFHQALDSVWEKINQDPAPAGRGIDEPHGDEALANEPAAVQAIRNPFQRAAVQQTATTAVSPGRVDLLQRMREFLKIPIGGNRGLIGSPKNVLGHFVHRPGKSIDLRNMGDIQTLAHEVGHYISNIMFGPQYQSSQTRRAFFHRYALALDTLSQTHGSPTPEEGFAEFTRLYMTNPAQVRADHLTAALAAEFDRRLQARDPQLFTFLGNWAEDYRAWRGSDLNDRIKGKVAFDPVETKRDMRDTMSGLYMKIFANSGPIERMVKDLSGGKMPQKQATAAVLRDLLQGTNRLAELFLFKGRHNEGGAIDYDTRRKTGQSLEEVVSPIKDKLRDWTAYMIQKRMDELLTRDDAAAVKSRRQLYTSLETSPQEVRREIAKWEASNPEFLKAHDDFQEWNQNLLEYLTKAGMLSPSMAKTMADMNKSYFPFYRVFSTAEQERESQAQGTGGPKRLKGSGRDFMNPLEGAIRNAYTYIKAAENNAVLLKMANLAQDPKASEKSEFGGQRWMKRVPPQLKVMKVPPAEVVEKVKQDLIQIGMDPQMIDDFLAGLNHQDVAQIVSIFRADHARLQPNEVVVMRRGQPEHYIVDPLLKQSIDQMMKPEADLLNKLYNFIPTPWGKAVAKAVVEGPARLLRAGATLAPEFAARNPFRDVFDRAWFSDKQTRIPLIGPMMDLTLAFAQMPRGAISSIRGDKWREAWLRGGGEMALASMDPRALQRKLDDVLNGRPSGISTKGWVLNPLQWMRTVSTISEEANRIEEFRQVLKSLGATPDTATKEQLQIAAHGGLTNPLDFGRMGTFMKWTGLNRAAAFSNVSLASWDKVVRELKGPNWMQRVNFAVSAITIPSLLLWYHNHDDGRWDDIPQWQKDLGWIVFTKKIPKDQWANLSAEERADPNIVGHVLRLPKPWQLGIMFGSIPERIADWASGVDKDFVPMLYQTLSEARLNMPIPSAVQTMWGLAKNQDNFTGRPVVSRGMQDLAPEDQIGQGTHHAAIWLAHGISTITMGAAPDSLRSPQAMDYIFYRTGGNLGRLGADVVDAAVKALDVGPPEPTGTAADIPGLRGFIARYPTSASESIEEFYKAYTQLQQVGKGAKWRQQNDKDVDAYTEQHEFDLAALPAATTTAQTLAHLRAQTREIQLDREMTPAAKRKALDETTLEMIDTAHEALQNLRAVRSGKDE